MFVSILPAEMREHVAKALQDLVKHSGLRGLVPGSLVGQAGLGVVLGLPALAAAG